MFIISPTPLSIVLRGEVILSDLRSNEKRQPPSETPIRYSLSPFGRNELITPDRLKSYSPSSNIGI